MNSRACLTLYQKSDGHVAGLRHLPASVIILRLRRPGDPRVADLEVDVRARLRGDGSLRRMVDRLAELDQVRQPKAKLRWAKADWELTNCV